MRQELTVQASLYDLFDGHEIGRELKAMSQWLDEHREVIGLVAEDLRRHGVKETGRQGLSAGPLSAMPAQILRHQPDEPAMLVQPL